MAARVDFIAPREPSLRQAIAWAAKWGPTTQNAVRAAHRAHGRPSAELDRERKALRAKWAADASMISRRASAADYAEASWPAEKNRADQKIGGENELKSPPIFALPNENIWMLALSFEAGMSLEHSPMRQGGRPHLTRDELAERWDLTRSRSPELSEARAEADPRSVAGCCSRCRRSRRSSAARCWKTCRNAKRRHRDPRCPSQSEAPAPRSLRRRAQMTGWLARSTRKLV